MTTQGNDQLRNALAKNIEGRAQIRSAGLAPEATAPEGAKEKDTQMPKTAKAKKAKTKSPKKAAESTVDVKGLRAKLTQVAGKLVSRETLAKAVGASGASVNNWETGTSISAKYLPKLLALKAAADAGKVDL